MSISGGGELAAVAADVEAMVARLDAEERARRRLIASVSHDLRTPITALRLIAEAIDDHVVDPSVRDGHLARMTVHVGALNSLAADLFELSRLEAGDVTWPLEQIAIDELVEETVDAMRPRAEAHAVHVDAGLPPSLVLVRGNAEHIRRVLFNLIENAIRHTPGGRKHRGASRGALGQGRSRGRRHWEGHPLPDRERVFQPFAVGDGHAAGSAGLGLAIARAIVEAHGGRIWLEDAAIGARVRFALPSASL